MSRCCRGRRRLLSTCNFFSNDLGTQRVRKRNHSARMHCLYPISPPGGSCSRVHSTQSQHHRREQSSPDHVRHRRFRRVRPVRLRILVQHRNTGQRRRVNRRWRVARNSYRRRLWSRYADYARSLRKNCSRIGKCQSDVGNIDSNHGKTWNVGKSCGDLEKRCRLVGQSYTNVENSHRS